MQRHGFKCGFCGKWHAQIPTDMGFKLPDAVWKIPRGDRERRVVENSDLCDLDNKRFFIRGVAIVPLTYTDGYFGWGLWVEVKKSDFSRYVAGHPKKGGPLRPFTGAISNRLPGYPTLLGKPVNVRPGPSNRRPTLWFPRSARHLMSLEQRRGIDERRHHEVLHQNTPEALR